MNLLRGLSDAQLQMIDGILDNPDRLNPLDRSNRRPPSMVEGTCPRGHTDKFVARRQRSGRMEMKCSVCKSEDTAQWRRRIKGLAA